MLKKYRQSKHSFKNWVIRSANSPHAELVLGAMAFVESIISPIPADIILMPMSAVQKKKWLWFALIATVTSVIGGIAGYLIGLGLFDIIGQPLVEFYHLQDELANVGASLDKSTFGAIFIGAFTPIPFKVFALAGGFFQINFGLFVLASLLGRGLRYLMVSWLMHRFGEGIAKTFYRYLSIFTLIVVAIILIWIFLV